VIKGKYIQVAMYRPRHNGYISRDAIKAVVDEDEYTVIYVDCGSSLPIAVVESVAEVMSLIAACDEVQQFSLP